MSLQGNATAKGIRGKINSLDTLTIDAYGVAVRNGFEGTVEEWLASLKGERGADGYAPEKGVDYFTDEDKQEIANYVRDDMRLVKLGEVTLLASAWAGSGSRYSQVVSIEGVTENSQVDLTPSAEQLETFHNKDLAFVTENEDGVVTVYAIGQKPENDYTIQVTITEVYV